MVLEGEGVVGGRAERLGAGAQLEEELELHLHLDDGGDLA
jgi:hypothetical protein